MARLFNSRRLCVPSLGSQARLGQEHKGDLQKECCTILPQFGISRRLREARLGLAYVWQQITREGWFI